MAFTIYTSSDAGSPGPIAMAAGNLLAVLDACLINGYGAKAAAGWTKPFTGTNKAAYLQGAGRGFYLRVQNDGVSPTNTAEALAAGYEAMSGVDAGTGPFPTSGQIVTGAVGACWRYQDGAGGTRQWLVAADPRTVYIFGYPAVSTRCCFYAFGDIYSVSLGDLYATILIGRNSFAAADESFECGQMQSYIGMVNFSGHAMPRLRSQLATGSQLVWKHGDMGKSTGSTMSGSAGVVMNGALSYPNAADGNVYLSPVWVYDTEGIRGRMRGLWHVCHSAASIPQLGAINGLNELDGKSFVFVKASPGGAVYAVETSDTLETN